MRYTEIPKYNGYSQKGFLEALLAGKHDERAKLALKRKIMMHPESREAAARAVLQEIGAL